MKKKNKKKETELKEPQELLERYEKSILESVKNIKKVRLTE